MTTEHMLKLASLSLAAIASACLSIGAHAQSAAAAATTTAAGTSAAATTVVAAAAATAAPAAPAATTAAAAPNAENELDEVVVTGTSIRGVAPVGSNLITLGRDQIDQTGAISLEQLFVVVSFVRF